MSTSPLVSVIVPTFNRGLYLRETLKSALSQTWQSLEIVVVDDGSSDNTAQIVQELCQQDARLHYYYQPNQGVSAARNRAIELAKGEYLAFLDSDDVWFPWKLELQMQLFAACPEVGMIWTNMDAISGTGELLHPRYLQTMYSAYQRLPAGELFSQMIPLENYCQNLPDEFHGLQVGRKKIYTEMFQGNLVHTPTVVLRADWARQVGPFDTQMRNGGEDYKYHLRTCRLGEVAFIDVSSIRYRIGMGDNITRKANNLNFALSYLRTITEEMNEHPQEHHLTPLSRRLLLGSAHDWLAHEYLEARQRQQSLWQAARAIYLRRAVGHSWKTLLKCIVPWRRKDLARLKFWSRPHSTEAASPLTNVNSTSVSA